jgi:hypothetical protein
MDAKNIETIKNFDPTHVLARFVNSAGGPAAFERTLGYVEMLTLPPTDPLAVAAKNFKQTYGELQPECEVWMYVDSVRVFRDAWNAKTSGEKEAVSLRLTSFLERVEDPKLPFPDVAVSFSDDPPGPATFDLGSETITIPDLRPNPHDPRLRPAISVNIESGAITIKPRTLLDWLVKSLLECRDRLAICKREGCPHPYYVKTHARQQFCCEDCANTIRQHKKEQWWVKNRERFIKKWRRERKVRRGSKHAGKQNPRQ